MEEMNKYKVCFMDHHNVERIVTVYARNETMARRLANQEGAAAIIYVAKA